MKDQHHVTYEPEVIRDLCRRHHEDITIVNTNRAEQTRRKLTNAERWELWNGWLAGKIQPVRTPNALAWIESGKLRRKKREKVPPEFRGRSKCYRAIIERNLTPYPNAEKWNGFSAWKDGTETFLGSGMVEEMRKMMHAGHWRKTVLQFIDPRDL